MLLRTPRSARLGARLVVGVAGAVMLGWAAAPGVAQAATISDRVTREVTLDAPGTATIDAFDPARGRLTQVSVSIEVSVLVQMCVENRQAEAGATSAASVTGGLFVELPDEGTSFVSAEAFADVILPERDLTAGDGLDDCVDGFDADVRRFEAPVSAPDAAYDEQGDQGFETATLTDRADLAPFIGPGTVTIRHVTDSELSLTVPAEWDAVSVAAGDYTVEVTYTYTPAADGDGDGDGDGPPGGPPGGRGPPLPGTGSSVAEVVALGTGLVLLGATAVLLAHRRQRSDP